MPTTPPHARPHDCGFEPGLGATKGTWVVPWLEDADQIDGGGQVDRLPQLAKQLGLVDFFWLGYDPAGRLVNHADGPRARSLSRVLEVAADANPCGRRFVTLVDAVPGRTTGRAEALAKLLFNQSFSHRQIRLIAGRLAQYPLADGLTLDFEYGLPATAGDLAVYARAAGLSDESPATVVDAVSGAYSEFVRQLAAALHHQRRLLRVAVPVRSDSQLLPQFPKPYIADYGEIATYADQVVLMAYDFHWSTGDPGPVAPLADLRQVIGYTRDSQVPVAKLTVALPAYGYDWTVDAAGRNTAGLAAADFTATQVAGKPWSRARISDGEQSYRYTDRQGRRHEVWNAVPGLAAKVKYLRQVCAGCGLMVWKTGNDDPVGAEAISRAFG